MILESFSYYFTVTDGKGGIFSLDFEFLPDVEASERGNVDRIKQTVKDDFRQLESLLDTSLLGNQYLEGEKKPTLTDSPHSLSAGYAYKLKLKHAVSMQTVQSLFFSVFMGKPKIPEKDGLLDSFSTITADLRYSFEKLMRKDSCPAKIILKTSLGHNLNYSTLQKILDVPGLAISKGAEKEIENLKQIVSSCKDADPITYLK